MTSSRRRRGLLIAAAAVVLLVLGAVAVETLLRARAAEALDDAAETIGDELPGATASLAGEPMLVQLASGGVRVDLAVPASALTSFADARLDVVKGVWFESGMLVLQSEIGLAGIPTPVEVGFELSAADGSLVALPGLVRVGGLQLPEAAITRVLGPDAEDGIEFGSLDAERFRVESVHVDGERLQIRLLLTSRRFIPGECACPGSRA